MALQRLALTPVLAAFVGVAVTVSGCSSDGLVHEDTDEGRMVVADDDRVVVDDEGSNVPEKYRALLDGFGVMYVNEGGFCTVTHLGKGIVLTAGHCVGAGDEAKKQWKLPAGASVRWGVRGSTHATWPTATSDVVEVIESRRSKPGPDYAFLKVDPPPPVALKVDLSKRPNNGTAITIFSHPLGAPLRWSRTCEVLPPQANGGPERFEHKCDTEGGSSGAAVIDDKTLAIVGIHDSDNGTDTEAATINQATYVMDTTLKEYLQSAE
jgi:V8-like Glu-specific endopeptidase